MSVQQTQLALPYGEEERSPSIPREPKADRSAGYWEAVSKARERFRLRSAMVGDIIVETGALGACVAIVKRQAKLRQLMLKSRGHGRNQQMEVTNLLLDLLNETVSALMLIEEDNWSGREQ